MLPSERLRYLLIENRWAVRRITKCYVDATAFAHAQLMLYTFVYIPAQRPRVRHLFRGPYSTSRYVVVVVSSILPYVLLL